MRLHSSGLGGGAGLSQVESNTIRKLIRADLAPLETLMSPPTIPTTITSQRAVAPPTPKNCNSPPRSCGSNDLRHDVQLRLHSSKVSDDAACSCGSNYSNTYNVTTHSCASQLRHLKQSDTEQNLRQYQNQLHDAQLRLASSRRSNSLTCS